MVLRPRRQRLAADEGGHTCWKVEEEERVVPAARVAVIVCDVWDRHWSRGASERVDVLAPRVDSVLKAARARGAHIIHAPSDTLEFYEGSRARLRAKQAPHVEPPADLPIPDRPLPIDDSDGGSDTGETPWHRAWSRQHPAVEIDEDRDAVSDDGWEIYSYLRQVGADQVVLLGVHTNMCVLGRSFGIKRWVRWGVPVMLVRDLTDTMYNPARSPYVSHDEGTRLVVEYIEKFWCPSVSSADLVG
ncbi:MAG TPA: isochorismatase [Armatimonadota bacterium]|jgi:nicotinamidase-related amidase